jgi:hypothetical protein
MKRLVWVPSVGVAEVRAVFSQGPKVLQLNMYMLIVLMLFKNEDSLTYTDVAARSKLGEDELFCGLMSLANPKNQILVKRPNVRTLLPTDTFSFNENFKSPHFRIKVPVMSNKKARATQKGEVGSALVTFICVLCTRRTQI